MGQKVHPIGFRLGISKDWQAKWYADKHYTELLQEDIRIRKAIESNYAADDVSRIEIERAANQVTVTIYTARPGIVIGRGGQRVDEMRLILEKVAGKRVRLNILEIARPEQDAYLVARSIAQQIQRRISHRRAMKQAISRAMDGGAQGIKITCSGRLTGSEYSRKETLYRGRVPLHTLRADIDYAIAVAHTTLGCTGVKVWIYKGDIIPEHEKLPIEAPIVAPLADREVIEEAKVEVEVEVEEEVKEEVKVDILEEVMVEKKPVAEDKARAKKKTAAKRKPTAVEETKGEKEVSIKEAAEAEAKAKKKTAVKQKPKAVEEAMGEKEVSIIEEPEAETKSKKTTTKKKPTAVEETKGEKEAPEAETKSKKTTAKKPTAEEDDNREAHEKKEG